MTKDIILQSIITCPECGFKKEETMPTDSCQFFYECTNCGKIIRPKSGDCCVYCSYGTVKVSPSSRVRAPNGKSAAMIWRDDLVVKLTGNSLNEALNLSGAKIFEPMEGRPMKEWVQIPFIHKDRWKEYTQLSIKLVKDLPIKSKK